MRAGTELNECSFDRLQSTETDHICEGMANLPSHQRAAITSLVEEINWLLRDETAAVLLDRPSPTEETLNFVARHVTDSNNRSSCYMDKVPLHFVFSSESSLPRFIEELKKLAIDRYCIRQEGNLFYFVKKSESDNDVTSHNNVELLSFKNEQNEDKYKCKFLRKNLSINNTLSSKGVFFITLKQFSKMFSVPR